MRPALASRVHGGRSAEAAAGRVDQMPRRGGRYVAVRHLAETSGSRAWRVACLRSTWRAEPQPGRRRSGVSPPSRTGGVPACTGSPPELNSILRRRHQLRLRPCPHLLRQHGALGGAPAAASRQLVTSCNRLEILFFRGYWRTLARWLPARRDREEGRHAGPEGVDGTPCSWAG